MGIPTAKATVMLAAYEASSQGKRNFTIKDIHQVLGIQLDNTARMLWSCEADHYLKKTSKQQSGSRKNVQRNIYVMTKLGLDYCKQNKNKAMTKEEYRTYCGMTKSEQLQYRAQLRAKAAATEAIQKDLATPATAAVPVPKGANSKQAKRTRRSRYSPDAMSAIESIASIVDKNDALIAVLRAIHSQCATILYEHDKTLEHDQPQEETKAEDNNDERETPDI